MEAGRRINLLRSQLSGCPTSISAKFFQFAFVYLGYPHISAFQNRHDMVSGSNRLRITIKKPGPKPQPFFPFYHCPAYVCVISILHKGDCAWNHFFLSFGRKNINRVYFLAKFLQLWEVLYFGSLRLFPSH